MVRGRSQFSILYVVRILGELDECKGHRPVNTDIAINLDQHRFLSLAVSPRRLIPRIRFACEMTRGVYYGINEDVLSDVQLYDCEGVSDK